MRKMYGIFVLLTFYFGSMQSSLAEPAIFVDLAADKEKGESVAIYSYLQPSICSNIDLSEAHVPRKDCIRDRAFASSGDTVSVYVKHKPLTKIKVEFSEVARNTVLKDDLSVLLKLVDGVISGTSPQVADNDEPKFVVTKYPYVLTHTRSDLKVSIDSRLVPDAVVFDSITGPKEHWFLSADFIVTEAKQLKYDSENSTLVERNKPSEYFLGINYMLGDILNEHNTLYERLYIKGFVKVGSRPLDSYGVGVGLRFNKLGSVFLAYNRFLEEAEPANSSVPDEQYGDVIGLGISLDLNSALSWLK